MTTTPIAAGPLDVKVSRQCTCHPEDKPPTPCEMRYAFRDCADEAEERYLRETLAMLQESYTKAAKPYLDRLLAIRNRKQPQMMMTVERAHGIKTSPNLCLSCGHSINAHDRQYGCAEDGCDCETPNA